MDSRVLVGRFARLWTRSRHAALRVLPGRLLGKFARRPARPSSVVRLFAVEAGERIVARRLRCEREPEIIGSRRLLFDGTQHALGIVELFGLAQLFFQRQIFLRPIFVESFQGHRAEQLLRGGPPRLGLRRRGFAGREDLDEEEQVEVSDRQLVVPGGLRNPLRPLPPLQHGGKSLFNRFPKLEVGDLLDAFASGVDVQWTGRHVGQSLVEQHPCHRVFRVIDGVERAARFRTFGARAENRTAYRLRRAGGKILPDMRHSAIVVAAIAAACSHAKAGEAISEPTRTTAARLVAVLEFRSKLAGAERSAVDADYLANAVRAAVLKTLSGARVLTRENMLVLLQAAGKKLEECEGECEVETGRRLGADLVVSGDLLRFGSSYKLDLRLHDTRSGELLAGAAASGETVDKLDHAVAPAVRELMTPLLPATARAAEAADPPGATLDPLLGFPASARCQGHSSDGNIDSPTQTSFQVSRRGPGAAGFHYESVRTRGDPYPTSVDGEWRVDPSTGTILSSAVSSRGDRFSSSSPGWQGNTMVELGKLETTRRETLAFRSTWTRHDAQRFTFRFELLLQGRWVTTIEDDCRW